MSSRDTKIKRTLLESGLGLLVAIYVMSSRDTKIKWTLLESSLGLLAKYTRKTRIMDTRVHDNMVPWALRALGTKTQWTQNINDNFFFCHLDSSVLRTGTLHRKELEEEVDKILHQVSSMADQLHNLTDAVSKFEKCKACKKKYYKSVDDVDDSFEDKLQSIELTPRPPVPAPPKAFNSNSPPVSSSTPLRPQKTTLGNQLQKRCNELEADKQSTMLIGSPSRGVYVLKKKVEQLPKHSAKGFALKPIRTCI